MERKLNVTWGSSQLKPGQESVSDCLLWRKLLSVCVCVCCIFEQVCNDYIWRVSFVHDLDEGLSGLKPGQESVSDRPLQVQTCLGRLRSCLPLQSKIHIALLPLFHVLQAGGSSVAPAICSVASVFSCPTDLRGAGGKLKPILTLFHFKCASISRRALRHWLRTQNKLSALSLWSDSHFIWSDLMSAASDPTFAPTSQITVDQISPSASTFWLSGFCQTPYR